MSALYAQRTIAQGVVNALTSKRQAALAAEPVDRLSYFGSRALTGRQKIKVQKTAAAYNLSAESAAVVDARSLKLKGKLACLKEALRSDWMLPTAESVKEWSRCSSKA